jgi:hypothetical protein
MRPVTLEILDKAGTLVRLYSSEDVGELPAPDQAPVPLYWYRPPLNLKTTAGMHRFLWDMRGQPLEGFGRRGGYLPMAAIGHNTAPAPLSMWVAPGEYTVRLTVGGRSLTQPITVKMDPRVKTPAAGLAQQFELSKAMYDGVLETQAALRSMESIRARVKKLQEKLGNGEGETGEAAKQGRARREALAVFDKKAAEIEGGRGGGMRGIFGPPGSGTAGQETLNGIMGSLVQLMSMLQAADLAPTTQLAAAVTEKHQALRELMDRWQSLRTKDLAAVNKILGSDQIK